MIPFKFDNGGILDEQLHLDSAKMILTKSVIRPMVMSIINRFIYFFYRIDNIGVKSVTGARGSQIRGQDDVSIWVARARGRGEGHLYGDAAAVIL
jgi:hypothetical protein